MLSLAIWIRDEGQNLPEAEMIRVWDALQSEARCFTAETVRFALTVVYDAAKPRWINPTERKIGGRAALAHDRRWYAVTEQMDGSGRGVLRVLCVKEEYGTHLFARLFRAAQVRRALLADDRTCLGIAALALPNMVHADSRAQREWRRCVDLVQTGMDLLCAKIALLRDVAQVVEDIVRDREWTARLEKCRALAAHIHAGATVRCTEALRAETYFDVLKEADRGFVVEAICDGRVKIRVEGFAPFELMADEVSAAETAPCGGTPTEAALQ